MPFDSGSQGAGYSALGTDNRSRGAESSRRAQRRVAEAHRKRSAQSCDLCRKVSQLSAQASKDAAV